MFDIIFKKSKINLDCFTYLPYAYDYAKIDYAIKFVPDWWKETPKIDEKTKTPTIKNCYSFIEFYKRGIIIPSWFEFELEIHNKQEKTWKWNCSSPHFNTLESHENSQFRFFANEFGHNLKMFSAWVFKTKENVHFTWTQPTWNMRNTMFNMNILPGVIEFKNQHATHINYFIENKEFTQYSKIEPLTPLVILHPLSDKNIQIKNHLVSEKEYDRINNGIYRMLFLRNAEEVISKRKKINKIISKNEKLTSKCPFGFGGKNNE